MQSKQDSTQAPPPYVAPAGYGATPYPYSAPTGGVGISVGHTIHSHHPHVDYHHYHGHPHHHAAHQHCHDHCAHDADCENTVLLPGQHTVIDGQPVVWYAPRWQAGNLAAMAKCSIVVPLIMVAVFITVTVVIITKMSAHSNSSF